MIQQELDRLDKEEAKYNKERQAKRDYYNSDAFLSRVYQLDPKTAEFLAGRRDMMTKKELEEADIANKYNIASLKLGDVTKKDKLELQQLWKDNTRALESAKTRGDAQAVIDEYQDNIDRIVAQLRVIDPVTWGEAKPTTEVTTKTTGTDDEINLKEAIKEGDNLIASAVDVNPKNGVIDDFAKIRNAILDLQEKYGISKTEVEKLLEKFYSKKQEIADNYAAMEKKSDTDFQRNQQIKSQSQSGGAVDQRMAQTKLDAINKDPSDIPARADAVLWIMRKNSGAVIGPSEILQYMQGKLPPENYNELVADLSPTGMRSILGLFTNKLDEAQVSKLTAKYLPYLKMETVKADLNVWANSKTKSSSDKPSGQGTKTTGTVKTISKDDPRLKGLTGLARARKIKELQAGK